VGVFICVMCIVSRNAFVRKYIGLRNIHYLSNKIYTSLFNSMSKFQSEAFETKNKYIQAVCAKEKSNESPIFNILNVFTLISSLFQSFKTIYKQFYKFLIPKVKVKFSRYRPGVAQRVGRVIALLFHDRGNRRG